MLEDALDKMSAALKANYVAQSALLIYERVDSSEKSGYYITEHPILGGEICAGKPLTKDALIALCSKLIPGLRQTLQYFPPNLIAFTPFGMAWWMPAIPRKQVQFSKATGIPSGPAPIPPMLFVVQGIEPDIALYAWALGENTRPTPQTLLYRAPFFNVHRDGRVCMGNAPLPNVINLGDIPLWERLFLETEYTDELEPGLQGTSGKKLWTRLIKTGAKTFPTDCLVSCGTVGGLLNVSPDKEHENG